MPGLPKINILTPFVADLIAAGEVVERPASVVKELVENAVDAGARNVTVELRGGGREYIRVTDDGCGMSPEDAGIAFLRHATSKLQNERGLEAIGTLGFRGEALAAISSVSHIELATRERGAPLGVRMKLDAGEIIDMYETGCPEGTTMMVSGLFYNTPARLKFMKTDRAEGAACVQAALRCALGRPDVSFRCIRNGQEEFFTPGDGRQGSAVYSLLGRELTAGMLEIGLEEGPVRVSGCVSAPGAARGNRSAQFFYCNGRHIRSQLLQAAVEQAFRGTLLTGRFPACVIYLELAPASVDVNVHPAKTEVKFSEERRVYDAVYYAVRGALEEPRRPNEAAEEEPKEPEGLKAEPEQLGEVVPMPSRTPEPPPIERPVEDGVVDYRRIESLPPPILTFRGSTERPSYPAQSGPAGVPVSTGAPRPGLGQLDVRGPAAQGGAQPGPSGRPVPPRDGAAADVVRAQACPAPERAAAQERIELPEATPAQEAEPIFHGLPEPPRVIGEALELYILVQQGDLLVIIDKHAAHERIIYDRLRRRESEVMSQTFLESVPYTPDRAAGAALSEELGLINSLGFELEPFGDGTFMLRSAPAGLEPDEALASLDELAEALQSNRRLDKNAARDELLKTVACKAAIKAGRSSEPEELQALAEAVCSGQVRYCPHGRPVSWTLTRRDLDKQFRRIL